MRKISTVLAHYVKAHRSHERWSDRAQLKRWQEERIVRHIEWVRARSPFYKELWAGRSSSAWREFPLINKTLMMENFDQLNTTGINKEEALAIALQAERTRDFAPRIGSSGVTVGLSSGTSGNRGLFLVSEEESWAWAGTMLGKVLPGPLWKPERVAFFLRANSNLYESVKGGRLVFRFFDLLAPMETHLQELESYQPTLLIGPPSVLRLLAEAVRDGKLRMRPPGKVVSVAEALDPLDELLIQEAFGQPVHQIYQCTEGFLAVTCSHGILHLNEDLVHIGKDELDQVSGRYSPVITDFTRRTQPIIRYRLDDVLLERTQPCACGSPFAALTRIEGRCDDLFYWPRVSGGEPCPVFPDFITRSIIQASEAITEYRAVQHAPGQVEIFIRLHNEESVMPHQVEHLLKQELVKLGNRLDCQAPELTLTLCAGAMHQDQEGRKLRRIERRFLLEKWSTLVRT